jgi:hypothetical protein
MNKEAVIQTIKEGTEEEAIQALDKYTSEYAALILLTLTKETQ